MGRMEASFPVLIAGAFLLLVRITSPRAADALDRGRAIDSCRVLTSSLERVRVCPGSFSGGTTWKLRMADRKRCWEAYEEAEGNFEADE